jgi:hypothetical protein
MKLGEYRLEDGGGTGYDHDYDHDHDHEDLFSSKHEGGSSGRRSG